MSPIPDSQAWVVDTLNIPWESLVAYAFLPTTRMPKVVQNLQSQTCRLILNDPSWPTKPLFWGSGGDVAGHTNTITTVQPLTHQPIIPEPPHLVSWNSALQQQGFTAEVAERIVVPQRVSTIYTSKWTIIQRCVEKQVDFRNL